MPHGPVIHRRQLGAELRRLRDGAAVSLADAAQALGCSPAKVSRIETGRGNAVARAEDVRRLCRLYGVTDDGQVGVLLDMLRVSQQPGWWEAYEAVLPSGLEVYVGLEGDARAERAWEPQLVHGLLQTPRYARAVFSAWRTNRPYDIDDLVEVRTRRQRLLTRDPEPLELQAILDEAVLRRPVGGPEVMGEQLTHLIAMAGLPNITIQVVPVRAGAHPGLGGAFSILEFDDDEPFAYVETPAGNVYVEKKNDVRRFTATFGLLAAIALAPGDSVALISGIAKEMQS